MKVLSFMSRIIIIYRWMYFLISSWFFFFKVPKRGGGIIGLYRWLIPKPASPDSMPPLPYLSFGLLLQMRIYLRQVASVNGRRKWKTTQLRKRCKEAVVPFENVSIAISCHFASLPYVFLGTNPTSLSPTAAPAPALPPQLYLPAQLVLHAHPPQKGHAFYLGSSSFSNSNNNNILRHLNCQRQLSNSNPNRTLAPC